MFQTLATKYRPKSFSELKGQDVLVKTLRQAVRNGQPFNAYLLTGIRGVGKTTAARVLAKTLNCSALNKEKVTPCGQCESCLACEQTSHPDVIEIDAASKTGVNDIRELIESAQYIPLLGAYKIYIIDEVHMLSNSAFNALLKTLEEPPANVVFVFATTEFHKIPKTVVSRCQKFDLRMFNLRELVEHLTSVCELEGIKHEHDALAQVAKYSGGSMRDSLSLLETIATYNGGKGPVTTTLVREVLGLAEVDRKYKLFNAVLTGDVQHCVELVGEVYYSGCDLFHVFEDLLSICNVASKAIAIKDYLRTVDMQDLDKTYLQNIIKKTDVVSLTTIWQVLFKGIQDLKLATNILEAAEILLIKLAYLSRLPTPEEVIDGIMSSADTFSKPLQQNKTIATFGEAVELFRKNGELILYHQMRTEVQALAYAHGTMELAVRGDLQADFAPTIAKKLEQWTQCKWTVVARATQVLDSSLKLQDEQHLKESGGMVKDVLASFPGTRIESVVSIE
jgi:DNA polymerase-3 subunit gamma/tau